MNKLCICEIITASSGKKVPAGATVIIATIKLHRRPDIYPNPDKFNPDNFLPEQSANRHYYAFVPFSAGPRSCVGELYKHIIVTKIIQEHDHFARKLISECFIVLVSQTIE